MMNNPYQPTDHVAEPSRRGKLFRWRVLPVTFFALLTLLVILATAFDFVILAYSLLTPNTPQDWHATNGHTFLRDGFIGLLQIPLFAAGTYCLWKQRYPHAIVLLVPAFFLRTIALYFFSN